MSIQLVDEMQSVCEAIGDKRLYISEYEGSEPDSPGRLDLEKLLNELGDLDGEFDTQIKTIWRLVRKCQMLVPAHRVDVIRDLKGIENWLHGDTRKITTRGVG